MSTLKTTYFREGNEIVIPRCVIPNNDPTIGQNCIPVSGEIHYEELMKIKRKTKTNNETTIVKKW